MSSRVITWPNGLTVVRMVLTPVFVSLLFYGRFGLALAVFITAGVTDGLDGLLARRFDQRSQLGRILDPIADKLLLVTSFIVLSSTFNQPAADAAPLPNTILGDRRRHQP
ncbi:MAG: CDP-alcohol phosphatidyltransferase family protein [Pyrinomonadaceae bacterium]